WLNHSGRQVIHQCMCHSGLTCNISVRTQPKLKFFCFLDSSNVTCFSSWVSSKIGVQN
ncbi:unnamed protein product, partial [Allacma fusca]